MSERLPRWLLAALWAWVALGAYLNLSWGNPDPPLVSRFEAIADALPAEGELGFASGRPDRSAGYAWSAFRYAVTPRAVHREGRRLRSPLVVADQLEPPPGYETLHDFGDGVRLLRRQ